MNKNLLVFYLITFLENFWLIAPVFVLYLSYIGLSYFQISFLLFVESITSILFNFIVGYLSDKIGRKKCLCLAEFLYILSLILFVSSKNFLVLVITFFIFGVSDSLFQISHISLIYEITRNNYLKFRGIDLFITFFSFSLANIAGSLLYTKNKKLPWIITSIICAINVTIIALFLKEDFKKKEKRINLSDIINNYKKTFDILVKNKSFIRMIIICCISGWIIPVIIYSYQQILLKNVGFGVKEIGVILSITNIIKMFSSLSLVKFNKILKEKILLNSISMLTILVFAILSLKLKITLVLSLILLNILTLYTYILFENFLNENIDEKHRGKALGIVFSTLEIISSVFLLVEGKIMDILGVFSSIFVTSMFLFLINAFLFIFKV